MLTMMDYAGKINSLIPVNLTRLIFKYRLAPYIIINFSQLFLSDSFGSFSPYTLLLDNEKVTHANETHKFEIRMSTYGSYF